jgi:2-phosphosulfolactate phosphatase
MGTRTKKRISSGRLLVFIRTTKAKKRLIKPPDAEVRKFIEIQMKFKRATLQNCGEAVGTVVVIDVLRAFSTAAYAFGSGATKIILAGTVDEALALRERFPGSLLMGEVGGLPLGDFDFSNSPSGLAGVDLKGKRMIQRTSAGTQGVVLSTNAERLLAGSLLVASATAGYISKAGIDEVTFVITGANAAGWGDDIATADDRWGDEDAACADYIEALLLGRTPDPGPYLKRVRESPAGQIFSNPELSRFPAEDVEYCTRLDAFSFVLSIQRENGLLIMSPVPVN